MDMIIRPARPSDRPWIYAGVCKALLNPRKLRPERFVLAELGGRARGMAQMRAYGDSSRELATLFVEPEFRDRGICSHLIRHLLAREEGAVYALVNARYAAHFAQFGFRPIPAAELPRDLAREYRLVKAVAGVTRRLGLRDVAVIPLRRPPGVGLDGQAGCTGSPGSGIG